MASWSSVDVRRDTCKFYPNNIPTDRSEMILDRLLQQNFTVALHKQYNLVKSTSVRPSLSDSLLPSSVNTEFALVDTHRFGNPSINPLCVFSSPDVDRIIYPEFEYYRQPSPRRKGKRGSDPRPKKHVPETRRFRDSRSQSNHKVSTNSRISSDYGAARSSHDKDLPKTRIANSNFCNRREHDDQSVVVAVLPNIKKDYNQQHPLAHPPWQRDSRTFSNRIPSDSVLVSNRMREDHFNLNSPFYPSLHQGRPEYPQRIVGESLLVRRDNISSSPPFHPCFQSQYRPESPPQRIPRNSVLASGGMRMDLFGPHSQFNPCISQHIPEPPQRLSSDHFNSFPLFHPCQRQDASEPPPQRIHRDWAWINGVRRRDHFSSIPPFHPCQGMDTPGTSASYNRSRSFGVENVRKRRYSDDRSMMAPLTASTLTETTQGAKRRKRTGRL